MFEDIEPLEEVIRLEDIKALFVSFWEDSLETTRMEKGGMPRETITMRVLIESGRWMELKNMFSLVAGRFPTVEEIETWCRESKN